MGVDIDAFIIVGRTTDDMKEIVTPEDYGYESWADMEIADWEHKAPALGTKLVRTRFGAYGTGEIFGAVAAETPKWDSEELDLYELMRLIDEGKVWFEEEFGLTPALYLIPRMW